MVESSYSSGTWMESFTLERDKTSTSDHDIWNIELLPALCSTTDLNTFKVRGWTPTTTKTETVFTHSRGSRVKVKVVQQPSSAIVGNFKLSYIDELNQTFVSRGKNGHAAC